MMPAQFTLRKKEKLKSRKLLQQVFANSKSFLVFPIKVFYLPIAATEPTNDTLKVGVGVSSKHFKRSVDRNRIKRQMREAYRLQKLPLHSCMQGSGQQLAIFFLYIHKEKSTTLFIQQKMELVIQKLTSIVHKTPATPID